MSESPRLLAVCRVHQLMPVPGSVGVSAIDKRPAEGLVAVHKLGLHGDVQANREHHGGEDQALYAYAQEDADSWSAELGRDIPPGFFGENLRTEQLAVTEAVIGERWRIGDTVTVEVTSPRVPCATFAHRMGEKGWVRRFTEKSLTGAYLRVLSVGSIRAGDGIKLVYRPDHGVTVGRFFRGCTPDDDAALLAAEAEGKVTLSADVKAICAARHG